MWAEPERTIQHSPTCTSNLFSRKKMCLIKQHQTLLRHSSNKVSEHLHKNVVGFFLSMMKVVWTKFLEITTWVETSLKNIPSVIKHTHHRCHDVQTHVLPGCAYFCWPWISEAIQIFFSRIFFPACKKAWRGSIQKLASVLKESLNKVY